MNSNPTGYAAMISTTVKAVLMALLAIGVIPWNDAQTSTICLAIAAVVDLALFLGLLKPRVTPLADPKTADGIALVPLHDRPPPRTD